MAQPRIKTLVKIMDFDVVCCAAAPWEPCNNVAPMLLAEALDDVAAAAEKVTRPATMPDGAEPLDALDRATPGPILLLALGNLLLSAGMV